MTRKFVSANTSSIDAIELQSYPIECGLCNNGTKHVRSISDMTEERKCEFGDLEKMA